MSEPQILRNQARCARCEQTVESIHRHDFVRCKCGALAVDGGTDYLKRLFNREVEWEERSTYKESPQV